MNVAELVGRTLAQLGVGYAFGVVGSGNFTVTNSMREYGVPYVAARHEGGAATMADAYSRISGRVAVVTTHQGCGLSNAVTGIGEAAKSRTPLIVVTADTAGASVLSNFKIDQDSLVRSVGAVAERVHSAESAVADTVRAFRVAVDQRRTVVLNLPLDVQAQQAPAGTLASVGVQNAFSAARASDESVSRLASLLENAERPVFIAGRGAVHAREVLLELAGRTGALVATSAVANGLFEGEEFSLGISGGFSSPHSAELIRGADLIVGWGCSLNNWTTRHGKLIGPKAVIVQVDAEVSAIGAHRHIDLGVLGDAGGTARAVLGELGGRPINQGYRTREVDDLIAVGSRWKDVETDDISTEVTIDPRVLSRRIDELLPKERTVAVDSGNFVGYPCAYLSVPDQFGSCYPLAFQSVGLGLSAAIGAGLARPDRIPIAAVGDGGFLMSISEVETMVRLGIPVVTIVYNDSGYGAEVHHFGGRGVDLDTVAFPDTDLAEIARGFGATGITVRRVEDLVLLEEWLAGPRDSPVVVDAKISDDGGAWWLTEAFESH